MTTHHSADARTALMATYIARHTNPAGMRSSAAACSGGSREWDGDKGKKGSTEGFGGCFGARGRTIYNADKCRVRGRGGKQKCATLRELERIDAEEERRRRYGEQFLMAARGDFDEKGKGEQVDVDVDVDVATADELFALYIHI